MINRLDLGPLVLNMYVVPKDNVTKLTCFRTAVWLNVALLKLQFKDRCLDSRSRHGYNLKKYTACRFLDMRSHYPSCATCVLLPCIGMRCNTLIPRQKNTTEYETQVLTATSQFGRGRWLNPCKIQMNNNKKNMRLN